VSRRLKNGDGLVPVPRVHMSHDGIDPIPVVDMERDGFIPGTHVDQAPEGLVPGPIVVLTNDGFASAPGLNLSCNGLVPVPCADDGLLPVPCADDGLVPIPCADEGLVPVPCAEDGLAPDTSYKTIAIFVYDETAGIKGPLLEFQCQSMLRHFIEIRNSHSPFDNQQGVDYGLVVGIPLIQPKAVSRVLCSQVIPYLYDVVNSPSTSTTNFHVVVYVSCHGGVWSLSSAGNTYEAGLSKAWNGEIGSYSIPCRKFIQLFSSLINKLCPRLVVYHYHFNSCNSVTEIKELEYDEKGQCNNNIACKTERWWTLIRMVRNKQEVGVEQYWCSISGYGERIPFEASVDYDMRCILPTIFRTSNGYFGEARVRECNSVLVNYLNSLKYETQVKNESRLWQLNAGYCNVSTTLINQSIVMSMCKQLSPSVVVDMYNVTVPITYREYELYLKDKEHQTTTLRKDIPRYTEMHWCRRINVVLNHEVSEQGIHNVDNDVNVDHAPCDNDDCNMNEDDDDDYVDDDY